MTPFGHLASVLRDELGHFHWKLLLARAVLAPLPPNVGVRLRTAVLRAAGFRIGRGTCLFGLPQITGPAGLYERLRVGRDVHVNLGCVLDLEGTIEIGDRVSIGHEVLLITTTHRLGSADRRAAENLVKPVRIREGAWLGSRSIILPGVTVGAGAVVAAGSVVTDDVAPNTVVGGAPAKMIRTLADGEPQPGQVQPPLRSHGEPSIHLE